MEIGSLNKATCLQSNTTTLFERRINKAHKFNFDEASILDVQANYKNRWFSKMVNIQKHTNTVNKRTDFEGLNTAYF